MKYYKTGHPVIINKTSGIRLMFKTGIRMNGYLSVGKTLIVSVCIVSAVDSVGSI